MSRASRTCRRWGRWWCYRTRCALCCPLQAKRCARGTLAAPAAGRSGTAAAAAVEAGSPQCCPASWWQRRCAGRLGPAHGGLNSQAARTALYLPAHTTSAGCVQAWKHHAPTVRRTSLMGEKAAGGPGREPPRLPPPKAEEYRSRQVPSNMSMGTICTRSDSASSCAAVACTWSLCAACAQVDTADASLYMIKVIAGDAITSALARRGVQASQKRIALCYRSRASEPSF